MIDRIVPARHTVCLFCLFAMAVVPLFSGKTLAAPAESAKPAESELPLVRIAYFVPSDREPLANYEERLDRVMTEVQRFYRDGMEAAGFGPKTFRLDRDEQGQLRVHRVSGKHPMKTYGRQASSPVAQEVLASLNAQGIDVRHETLVIFGVLLAWEDGKATEIGPYCGGKMGRTGVAWVFDDALLDARHLASKEPGGYYHRPCSIGKFNSHYIGGVVHELGHAFGLPHACQRKADRNRGTALMGAGNHTYGDELRGQGNGTFLTRASAMLLAQSRPFAGDPKKDGNPKKDEQGIPTCKIIELKAESQPGKLLLSGRLTAEPAVFGIAAYNDWAKIPGNYDAVAWTADVDEEGRFQIEIGEIRPGRYQLRLAACHADGSKSRFVFDYQADPKGRPATAPFLVDTPTPSLGAYSAHH